MWFNCSRPRSHLNLFDVHEVLVIAKLIKTSRLFIKIFTPGFVFLLFYHQLNYSHQIYNSNIAGGFSALSMKIIKFSRFPRTHKQQRPVWRVVWLIHFPRSGFCVWTIPDAFSESSSFLFWVTHCCHLAKYPTLKSKQKEFRRLI